METIAQYFRLCTIRVPARALVLPANLVDERTLGMVFTPRTVKLFLTKAGDTYRLRESVIGAAEEGGSTDYEGGGGDGDEPAYTSDEEIDHFIENADRADEMGATAVGGPYEGGADYGGGRTGGWAAISNKQILVV